MLYKKKFFFIVLTSILKLSSALFEGDPCVLLSDKSGGECLNINKCASALDLLRNKGITPQSCGFNRNSPLVCCPNNSSKIRQETFRSDENCYLHYNTKNQGTDIAHGEEAKAAEFPHMVAVGFGDNKKSVSWLCGGTLISDRFVVTAAHCIGDREFGDPKWVRLGELNLNATDDTEIQEIGIAKTFAHPEYKPPSHYNDIALLKLQSAAIFGGFVQPACIHTKEPLPSKLQVTGWGKTDFLGDSTPHLMKADLNIIEHSKCAQIYSTVSTRKLARGIDKKSQICAGDSIGKDTCPGDSGGPLHFISKSSLIGPHYVVAGITSFGKGCGTENSAGVYTKVSAYRKWIEDIVWPLE